MQQISPITSPVHPALAELCAALSERARELDISEAWPAEQLRLCGEYGVFRWFLPEAVGGFGWSDADVIRGYLRLSAACLTTTFVITQRTGACLRIAGSENEVARARWLPDLAKGDCFATVAISHLSTSRRHLAHPAMRATEVNGGYALDGFSAWVTGGCHADVIVTGAVLEDGQQILVALPTDLPGITAPPPPKLVGLSASHTGELRCERVRLSHEHVLAGPVENVMTLGTGGGTGGLQTSTLAIGTASAAIAYLEAEASRRSELSAPTNRLRDEQRELEADLLMLAAGQPICSNEELRTRANSLVLRATQAALAAAKGTGYVIGHPAGRWCREALFFLVWSCPQPVVTAQLCELAGLE
jgi:alkylation response protein AidB-like acyl-CoA dehydrogenase